MQIKIATRRKDLYDYLHKIDYYKALLSVINKLPYLYIVVKYM